MTVGPVVVNNWGANNGGVQQVINGPATLQFTMPGRPRVTMLPPAGAISEEQALRLRELVAEIVTLEKVARRDPKGFGQIWLAFQLKHRVTSYKSLPAERFAEAEAWLLQWRARLSNTKSARKTGADWRKSRYAFIKAAAREIGREADVDRLLAERYAGRRLSELSDEELQAVYQSVGNWKNQARRNGSL